MVIDGRSYICNRVALILTYKELTEGTNYSSISTTVSSRYFLIPYGQKRIRPTLVSMYSYIQPIIATVISIILAMNILT